MNNFKDTDLIYIYDGTIEGLLTVIYKCCQKKEIPLGIFTIENYQQSLFDNIYHINTNYQQSKFINDKLLAISDYNFYLIYTAFLSCDLKKEIIILKYFIQSLIHGYKINGMKNNDDFIAINYLCKKVKGECHRFHGFLRFKELPGKVLYAVIEPDHNIIENQVEFFKKRLKNEHFIIYDKKRGIIATYNTKECNYFYNDDIDIHKLESLSIHDDYERMWQKYFNTIAIKERTNRRCQINFMPKKYWKNMLEMEGKL